MKRILLLITITFSLWAAFMFYGSMSSLSQEDYLSIEKYPVEQRNSSDTFTVMTYNLGYLSGMTNNLPVNRNLELFNNNLGKTVELIKKYDPDIIGLQEIDFDAERSFNFNQQDALATRCNYPNASMAINWDKNYVPFPFWPPTMNFGRMVSGQSIISKGRINDVERIILEKPRGQNFLYNAFYIERLIHIAKIKLEQRELIVLNVHLEAFDKETREAQAEVVRSVYERYSRQYPVLLIGDFNSEPSGSGKYLDITMSTILGADDIEHAYSKADFEVNATTHYTFSSVNPYCKIDYVLYNPSKIEKLNYKVLKEAKDISDHLPVLMQFKFIES